MTKGILFYSNNKSPLVPFAVATHSLRKHYDGPIHIVFGPNTPRFIKKVLKAQDRITYSFAKKRYSIDRKKGTQREEWREKPHIIKNESPFDLTLYYDCDHCFFLPVGQNIFDEIESKGLVTAMGKKKPSRHRQVLKCYKKVGDQMPRYYKVNGGCVGYKKGCPHIDLWLAKSDQYRECNAHILRRNSEEFGLGYCINNGKGARIEEKYSVCLGKRQITDTVPEGTIGMHYVSLRWLWAPSWGQAFKKAIEDNHLELKDRWERYRICTYPKHIERIIDKNGVVL